MSFFPERPDPADPMPEYRQPVWADAPDDILPGIVPTQVVLGRSDNAVVQFKTVRAYPTGLQISLAVRVRHLNPRKYLADELLPEGPTRHAGQLKWGMEFADGSKVTNVDPLQQPEQQDQQAATTGPDYRPDWQPKPPLLLYTGGSGDSRSVDLDYWLWPLPPPGTLRVVCQWHSQGIEQIAHELDAQLFLNAAARARPVWPTT